MRQLVLAITLMFWAAGVAVSQTHDTSGVEVVWGPGASCGQNNSLEVKSGLPVCQRIETDRGVFYLISFGSISVAISRSSQSLYVRALVQITNRSNRTISFNPLESSIDVFDGESEYVTGMGPHRTSRAMTGQKAEAAYIQSLTVAYAAPPPTSVASPGIQAPTRTITSVDEKRSDMSTTRPDGTVGTKAETVVVMAPGAQRSGPSMPNTPSTDRTTANSATLLTFSLALSGKTIAPDGKVGGYMFFEPVKTKTSYKVYKIKIDDLTFVFPEEIATDQKH